MWLFLACGVYYYVDGHWDYHWMPPSYDCSGFVWSQTGLFILHLDHHYLVRHTSPVSISGILRVNWISVRHNTTGTWSFRMRFNIWRWHTIYTHFQGMVTVSFVMVLELFGMKERTLGGLLPQFVWCITYGLLAMLFFLIRHWRHLLLTLNVPLFMTIVLLWCVQSNILINMILIKHI